MFFNTVLDKLSVDAVGSGHNDGKRYGIYLDVHTLAWSKYWGNK